MYLLDTNICSAILDENPVVLPKFYPKYSQCYLTTIIIAELYKGAYCSQQITQNIEEIEEFIGLISTVVEFDRDAAEEFGKIQGELRRIGRPTGDLDVMIASVARSRGDILVTHNTRDFINIPGLQLEDWLEPD